MQRNCLVNYIYKAHDILSSANFLLLNYILHSIFVFVNKKRTYPERGIHPHMQSLAGASPARGLHFQKTQPPHAETMVCGGGCGLFLGAVAEGDFFFCPAGFTGGVFTVSTADIIPTVGAVFLFSPCNCIRLTAYSTNVRRADAAAQRLHIPSDSRRNRRMCSGHSPFSQRCKVRSGTR